MYRWTHVYGCMHCTAHCSSTSHASFYPNRKLPSREQKKRKRNYYNHNKVKKRGKEVEAVERDGEEKKGKNTHKTLTRSLIDEIYRSTCCVCSNKSKNRFSFSLFPLKYGQAENARRSTKRTDRERTIEIRGVKSEGENKRMGIHTPKMYGKNQQLQEPKEKIKTKACYFLPMTDIPWPLRRSSSVITIRIQLLLRLLLCMH